MKVSEKLWQNTKASQELNIFPGLLGEFLIGSGKKMINRAKIFLPHIFWRWYFLESEVNEGTNPYLGLAYIQKIEKWPKNGQFFAQAKIEKIGENKHNISIILDYVSFEEQPLISDLKNILANCKSVFNFDKKYSADLEFLRKYCQEQTRADKDLPLDRIYELIRIYFEKNLEDWHKSDRFIQECFSLQSWFVFWRRILKDINQQKEYSTEELMDDFSNRMRQVFPNYGYTSKELEENSLLKEDFSSLSFMNFWFNFAYYILVPFSFYLHLLTPAFMDKELFRADIKEILDNDYVDPMPIYSACSYFYFTPFGRRAFKYIIDENYASKNF